ncbi:MAG: hypothetical protein Q8929_21070, partial [Bacillota bacterium]|nr:hypothetical protein [Bacillota bacterium]
MRLVETSLSLSGTYLGKAIFNNKGQTLLNEGVQLDARLLQRLIEMNIHYLYIQDRKTEDLELHYPISMKLRRKAITSIQKHFDEIESNRQFSNVLVLEKAAKSLIRIIREIQAEIKDSQDLLALLSDVYTYDNYIFTHSLNVT